MWQNVRFCFVLLCYCLQYIHRINMYILQTNLVCQCENWHSTSHRKIIHSINVRTLLSHIDHNISRENGTNCFESNCSNFDLQLYSYHDWGAHAAQCFGAVLSWVSVAHNREITYVVKFYLQQCTFFITKINKEFWFFVTKRKCLCVGSLRHMACRLLLIHCSAFHCTVNMCFSQNMHFSWH